VTEFTPFQISVIDVNEYIEKRKQFEAGEWLDSCPCGAETLPHLRSAGTLIDKNRQAPSSSCMSGAKCWNSPESFAGRIRDIRTGGRRRQK